MVKYESLDPAKLPYITDEDGGVTGAYRHVQLGKECWLKILTALTEKRTLPIQPDLPPDLGPLPWGWRLSQSGLELQRSKCQHTKPVRRPRNRFGPCGVYP